MTTTDWKEFARRTLALSRGEISREEYARLSGLGEVFKTEVEDCEDCNYTPCVCGVPASELGEGR